MYNVTASALLIHILGNPSASRLIQYLDENRLCCMDMDDYYNVLKGSSTAIRRTGRWPDGPFSTLDERTGCTYWELALGRSGNKSDRVDEKRKRTEVVVNLGPQSREINSREPMTPSVPYWSHS